MADEDYEFVVSPDGMSSLIADKVASRTAAYIDLLVEANKIKDDVLMAEALEMLKRVRLSIGVNSEATLSTLKGGKAN
jgi:hypothetical protein